MQIKRSIPHQGSLNSANFTLGSWHSWISFKKPESCQVWLCCGGSFVFSLYPQSGARCWPLTLQPWPGAPGDQDQERCVTAADTCCQSVQRQRRERTWCLGFPCERLNKSKGSIFVLAAFYSHLSPWLHKHCLDLLHSVWCEWRHLPLITLCTLLLCPQKHFSIQKLKGFHTQSPTLKALRAGFTAWII